MQAKTMSPVKMKPGVTVQPVRSAIGLVLWLASGLGLAGLYTFVNLSGFWLCGLGWAVRPGLLVLVLIIALAATGLRVSQWLNIVRFVLCLVATLFLEFLSIPRSLDSFIGITLSLLAASCLFNSVRKIRVAEALLLVVISYVQSVFLYNLFRGEQMMFFFKQGWTM